MGTHTPRIAVRILAAASLFLAVFLSHLWLALCIGILISFFYKTAPELLVAGVCVDLLYGTDAGWRGIPFPATLLFSGVFLGVRVLSRAIRLV